MVDEKHAKMGCCVSSETINLIYAMDQRLDAMHPLLTTEIPQMKAVLNTVAEAQKTMAYAASSMAATNEKAEQRYARLEDRLQDCNERASGKGQIPIMSHYIVLGGTVLISVLIVLYVNRQTMDATLTSIKVGQEKIESKLTNDAHAAEKH